MAGFNPMPTMTGSATGGAMALNPNQFEDFNADPLNFNDGLLENVNGTPMPSLPFTPSYPDFDPFQPAFEDPFAYPATGPYGHGAGYNPGMSQNTPQMPPQPMPGSHPNRPPPNRPPHTHTHAHPANTQDDAASPQELDDKLLGFSTPTHKAHIIDEATGHVVDVSMNAELYGMFFVAEDVFAVPEGTSGGNAAATPASSGPSAPTPNPAQQQQQQQPPMPKPPELTCYRRNLWQCSGSLTLPRHVRQVVGEQGIRYQITELAASIGAIESIDKKATEIISIPWKSSTNAGGNQEEPAKSAGAPPNIPLDLASAEASVSDDGRVTVTLPVAWKRLQFKHATANNGRRKGLQQHYVVQIALLAKVNKGNGADGEWIRVAEISSGAVIVRGRSPRNFDSRKDVPLTGSTTGKVERRSTVGSAPGESGQPKAGTAAEVFLGPGRYQSLGSTQQQTNEWALAQTYNSQSSSQHASKKVALSPRPNQPNRPPIPSWSTDPAGTSSSRPSTSTAPIASAHKSPASRPTQTLPINLSLSEDERSSPNRSGSDMAASPQFASKAGPAANAGPNSPAEDTDLLYEYFPLSLDDWSPPVDAIYRPHVVHHTIVPPDLKAQQTRSKAKRYFAAD